MSNLTYLKTSQVKRVSGGTEHKKEEAEDEDEDVAKDQILDLGNVHS